MRVVDDVHDMLIYDHETGDGIEPPIIAVLTQCDDCWLAVHLCHRKPPRHDLAFIVPKEWRFVEQSGKTIGNAESSIRSDKFAESFPITLIEAVDVEMQKP